MATDSETLNAPRAPPASPLALDAGATSGVDLPPPPLPAPAHPPPGEGVDAPPRSSTATEPSESVAESAPIQDGALPDDMPLLDLVYASGVPLKTPKTLRDLAPPSRNTTLSMDQLALRFRGKVDGVTAPSIGFGPRGASRAAALDDILDRMWHMAGLPRPAETKVANLPSDILEGILAPRTERPKKYQRKS